MDFRAYRFSGKASRVTGLIELDPLESRYRNVGLHLQRLPYRPWKTGPHQSPGRSKKGHDFPTCRILGQHSPIRRARTHVVSPTSIWFEHTRACAEFTPAFAFSCIRRPLRRIHFGKQELDPRATSCDHVDFRLPEICFRNFEVCRSLIQRSLHIATLQSPQHVSFFYDSAFLNQQCFQAARCLGCDIRLLLRDNITACGKTDPPAKDIRT